MDVLIDYAPDWLIFGPTAEDTDCQIATNWPAPNYEQHNSLEAVSVEWSVILFSVMYFLCFLVIWRASKVGPSCHKVAYDLLRVCVKQQRSVAANIESTKQLVIFVFVVFAGYCGLYYSSCVSTEKIARQRSNITNSIEDLLNTNLELGFDRINVFHVKFARSKNPLHQQLLKRMTDSSVMFNAEWVGKLGEVIQNRRAMFVPSGLMRTSFEAAYCVNSQFKNSIHYSEERLFPTTNTYFYNAHISSKLKQRLDWL